MLRSIKCILFQRYNKFIGLFKNIVIYSINNTLQSENREKQSIYGNFFPNHPRLTRLTRPKCDDMLVSPETVKSHYLCHFWTKKSLKIDPKSIKIGHFLTKCVNRPNFRGFSGDFPGISSPLFFRFRFSPLFFSKKRVFLMILASQHPLFGMYFIGKNLCCVW